MASVPTPPGQTWLQAPQLLALLLVSTQLVPHWVGALPLQLATHMAVVPAPVGETQSGAAKEQAIAQLPQWSPVVTSVSQPGWLVQSARPGMHESMVH